MTEATYKTSVLILDDDIFQVQALKKKLNKLGYAPIAVTQGLQAIEAVTQQLPDIVLLDIRLEGQAIDGIEVGHKIRQIDPSIIIIYITAYGNDENFKKALASNPYAFIEKPYQLKQLNREIEMAVKKIVKEKNKQPAKMDKAGSTKKTGSKILTFPNFLLIKDGTNGHQVIPVEEVLYLKADGAYTNIHTTTGKTYCLTMVLKRFDELFKQQANFDKPYLALARIHNSFIVNLGHIQQVQVNKDRGKLSMQSGLDIPVSNSYVNSFWKRFEDFSQA